MRITNVFDGVQIFLAVADAGSFTRAAKTLGISPSAASQAIRALEDRLGIALLTRSTRSLRLTAAGAIYRERAAPALAELTDATVEAMGATTTPAGLLRLTMPRAAYDGLIAHALPSFRRAYPLIELEIDVDGGLVDIVERGFDAGLRYGHLLAKGMESIEVLGTSRSVLSASPAYLAEHKRPKNPADLNELQSIVCRSRTTGLISPWLLTSGRGKFRVEPRLPIIAGDLATQIDLTVRGLGVSCTPLQCVANHLEDGRLVHLISDWSVPLESIHLYYPVRRAQTPAIRALRAHLERQEKPYGVGETAVQGVAAGSTSLS